MLENIEIFSVAFNYINGFFSRCHRLIGRTKYGMKRDVIYNALSGFLYYQQGVFFDPLKNDFPNESNVLEYRHIMEQLYQYIIL